MSRVGTPFSDAGEDAFLPSIEQDEGGFETYHEGFGGGGTPVFSNAFEGDVLDELDLGLDDGSIAPSSSCESGRGTPNTEDAFDFGGYAYEVAHKKVSVYPGPDELTGSIQPYPTHQQTQQPTFPHASTRPLPYRSTTNGHTAYAPSPLQHFHQAHHPPHRRSYSQNDTERLANLHHLGIYPPPHPGATTNPTFVRLCETRNSRPAGTKSSTESKRHHTQARSIARSGRAHPHPPTSIPVGIGHPLPQDYQPFHTTDSVKLTGARMVHMPHVEQRRTSQKIIEVGAMAVLNKRNAKGYVGAIDPALLDADLRKKEKSAAPSPEALGGGRELRGYKMFGDLEGIERGKRVCEIVGEVLGEMEDKGGGGGGREESFDGVDAVVRGEGDTSRAGCSEQEDDEFMRRLLESSPSPSA